MSAPSKTILPTNVKTSIFLSSLTNQLFGFTLKRMNIYYVIAIIVGVVTWTMAIISLIAQVRTWQILKEISSSLGGFPEVEKARAKREAQEFIDLGYVPEEYAERAKELSEFLSSLTNDKEAKLLLKDIDNLDIVRVQ